MPRWSLRLGWPPLLIGLFLLLIASSLAQHLPEERPSIPRFHGGSSSSSISAVSGVSHYDDPPVHFGQHTVRCYSCMSRLYGAIWENHLALLYKKPKNFTDACDNLAGHPDGAVPAVHCTSICLSMTEDTNIAGVRVKTHIRGCMSDVLTNGFNTTIVQWYRWLHRDSCRMYRKKELFKLPGDFNDDSMIEVCTCYDNNCNGRNSSNLPIASSLCNLLLLLSSLLLIRL
ncbi:hypothetical protein PFISCL1PPCAC_2649 [Pristionchus fissidentatus]|uniref:Uncharacterized protein n=1 Tax=Pristionchus fissidentatus TaxID=1538716 RepID=A0AAV5UZ32_9BILA|nr:hypothetical protein PFISCL1PPCAC_2649 [Pristionchus fissidentatus]